MAFAEILGHERIRSLLARALEADRLPHAMLFAGPQGVGKKALAIALGLRLVCQRPGVAACGECGACRRTRRALEALSTTRQEATEANKKEDDALRFNFRLHPDLAIVEQPWKRREDGTLRPQGLLIGQLREVVAEVRSAPFEAKRRLYVLDDAHTLNEAASNTLLKSLEEPPSHTHFVLVTHAPQALLRTIRSRCQQFRFGPLSAALIEKQLIETAGVEPSLARVQAAMADGSLKNALEFQSGEWERWRETMLGLLEAAAVELPVLQRLEAADSLRDADDDHKALALRALRSLLRDVAAARLGAHAEQLLNTDVADQLGRLGASRLGERAVGIAEAVAEAQKALKGQANAHLTLDLLLDAVAY